MRAGARRPWAAATTAACGGPAADGGRRKGGPRAHASGICEPGARGSEGRLYKVTWYGERYAVLKTGDGVEILKFYPDEK